MGKCLFPNYSEKIAFGSLSLNETGMKGYGGVHMVLRTDVIAERSSVFEENGMVFAKHHSLDMTDEITPGYRATWHERAKVVVAKLAQKLKPGMTAADFADLLQVDNGGGDKDEFVEFHLFDSFNRDAIEKAVAQPLANDKDYWESILKRLRDNNIPLQTETR